MVAPTLTRSHWLLSLRQALHSALSADAAAHSFPQADRAALDKRVADAEARAAAAAAALSVEVRTHAACFATQHNARTGLTRASRVLCAPRPHAARAR